MNINIAGEQSLQDFGKRATARLYKLGQGVDKN